MPAVTPLSLEFGGGIGAEDETGSVDPSGFTEEAESAGANTDTEALPEDITASTELLTSEEYEAMTVTALREMAKELGITGYSSMNKAALIDAIKGAYRDGTNE